MIKEALQYLQSLATVDNLRIPSGLGVYPSEIVTVPAGRTVMDLEKFQKAPNRIKHKATIVSAGSFAAYVNRFKGAETSIYVDIFAKAPSLVAVIDHHGKEAPTWGGHVATFTPKLSMEWLAWKALHESDPFDQGTLVSFIEAHANDLAKPSPAAMLTAVQTFETVEKHTYKSATNLDNGNVEIVYVKDGNATKVAFPHTLTLSIPIFENEEPITLDGRLRYRTSEGKIAFFFQFKLEPERVQRDALRGVEKSIREQIGADVQFYEGTAA